MNIGFGASNTGSTITGIRNMGFRRCWALVGSSVVAANSRSGNCMDSVDEGGLAMNTESRHAYCHDD